MKKIKSILQKSGLLLSMILLIWSCTSREESLINTAHLDHLYQEIEFQGKPAAIIHIYAEYPDYDWTEAKGEGIACMDDIARAAVFYLRDYQSTGITESLHKFRMLMHFILAMQAENGYFYNFIDADYRIVKTSWNSQPVGNWWSWRALWAMGEALSFYKNRDDKWTAKLDSSIGSLLEPMSEYQDKYDQFAEQEGIKYPLWLPVESAGDQAAVALLGLVPVQKDAASVEIKDIITLFADGLLHTQHGDSAQLPFGAFMSWRNQWHAYGNTQSDALLNAGELLNRTEYINAALLEIDHFYPFLLQIDHLKSFSIEKNDSLKMTDKQKFEQIAYGIRPMVRACLRANEITGNSVYAERAADIACWLLGKNPAGEMIYDPETGRCYDGINSPDKINMNSGAESTIEALLTIQAVENNPVARKIFHDYYQTKKSGK